jgi:sulfide dehydrogenase [flavocytochrome c] flavoprotein chain
MNNVEFNRRRVLQAAAGASALSGLGLAGCVTAPPAPVKKLGKVMIVGAGFGGATAAKYLKLWGGDAIDVMLVDRNPQFISCPLSNLVIGGSKKMEELATSYTGLREAGVVVLRDEVTAIDTAKRKIVLTNIADQSYDRLIVAPGVDFMYDQVQGLNAEAQKTVLHAWKAGAETTALRAQLEAMPDGGTYVITIPKAPYRCPPGPYERACQVAWYFKTKKPKSKVLILDANEDVQSKKGLFMAQWNGQYKGIVEYRPNSNVTEVDAKNNIAITELGEKIKADVLNVIPPMRAGNIAQKAGLINVNSRWCDVDWTSMESTAVKGVHVLGDATMSAPAMPKSGHMANQHGKTAAAGALAMMQGFAPQAQMMANTCYSFVDDQNVVHVASVHAYDAARKTMVAVPGSGGLSSQANALEGAYANAWAKNIWADMFS